MNKMKILFLGTSAGWPLPRLGCKCKICASTDPKDKRWRSSILINDTILIDSGVDFYHQIHRSQKTNLKAIFISHVHPDHYFGLWDVGHLMSSKPTIYLSSENQKAIVKRINDLMTTFLLREAKNFKHSEAVKTNEVKITPFLVDHSTNIETYGFQLVEKKKSLVYISDLRNVPKSSQKYCQKADILALDGSNLKPAGPKQWGHMPIEKSIPLAKKLKAKRVYYTHIGHGPKSGTHQELENFVQKKGGKNFHIAYDGLELTI